jgi:RimJ/RimL family protein N-acetyltransferase
MPDPVSPPPPAPRPVLTIRPARLGDVGRLVEMYRAQDAASRQLYHPFPFDRLRCTLMFTFFAGSRRMLPFLVRHAPRRAVALLVACRAGEDRPIAYGTTAFQGKPEQGLRAIFGYLVDPSARGLGVGTELHVGMIEESVALGVHRGGGMVVATNRSNLRVLEKLGFTISESDIVDSAVPGEKNFVTDGNLDDIVRQWRAAHPR